MQIRRLRLRKPIVNFLKAIGIICAFFIAGAVFYEYQIHDIEKLGYSKIASEKILMTSMKSYVKKVGKNKLLNRAFESSQFKEENLDSYTKIDFFDQENVIKNINTLIDKGYSNNDISIILAHGDDEDVTLFAKKDKIKYLEEFYSISYAKLKFYDRYVEFSRNTGEDEETTVLFVNLGMDREAYAEYNLVDRFSTDMLVNKYNRLSEDFRPDDLVDVPLKYGSDDTQKGTKVAVEAFKKMAVAAEGEGLGLVVNSSYRSFQEQEELCNYYRNLYGDNYVNKYVALPGFSEHQTGLAFDIGSTTSSIFANSNEYKWMLDNAYKYGFVLRFPKSGESITGFRNEPWHYRYVGEDIAKYLYDNGITFEEYYAEFLV